MSLKVIVGPMKSGKSFELINYFAPLKYSDITFRIYHPYLNVRDENILSRIGAEIEAFKINSLSEIKNDVDIIGIDEIHMFKASDVKYIKKLLMSDVDVLISGLDMDYRGKMFDIIKNILELGPDIVLYKKAVCEVCKSLNAIYTQLSKDGKNIYNGVPSVVPDDGTYIYKAVCRRCFENKL